MSICGRKKSLFPRICGFLFILTLCLVLHYWKRSRDWGPWNENAKEKIRPGDFCKGQLASGTITPLPDRQSFIITPYSDRRQGNLVRVLSIIHHQKVKELYCIFCCENSQEIQVVQGEIDFHLDRFDFPYGTADLLCLQPEDCEAHFISVHPWNPQLESTQLALFPIQNLFPEKPPLDFTICMSTMFGKYNNVLQFVQSMELYRLLGVQKVTIYKNSCSPLMEKVLDYYISQGIVEIIPWPIDLYLNVSTHWHYSMERKDLGYYGQIVALNDCIYHNMFKSKYLLLIDPDEVILPVKDRDWKSLMDRLEKEHPEIGVFLFENQVFRRTVFSKTPFNFSSWAAVPGFNVFEHIHKEPNDIHSFNNMKMILDPTRVIQTSVHSVLKQDGTSIQVLSDLAFNFHCRILERTDVHDRDLIRDPIFWRYNKTLIPKVNDVLLKSALPHFTTLLATMVLQGMTSC
uniref:Glycosyltransferase family 92 protein n=1 Tax=Pseudonaja textilis TaxID=8673 RepID=A0A670YDB2_PSETE